MNFDQFCWMIDHSHHFRSDEKVVARGFETSFMTDLCDRFEEEGAEMFMSHKMMNILWRIGRQRYGMVWSDYVDPDCPDWLAVKDSL